MYLTYTVIKLSNFNSIILNYKEIKFKKKIKKKKDARFILIATTFPFIFHSLVNHVE